MNFMNMDIMQYAGVAITVIFGAGVYLSGKLLPVILKRDPEEMEIVKYKLICMLGAVIGTCLVFIPTL